MSLGNTGIRTDKDNSTNNVVVITSQHHEIHEGDYFYIEGIATLGIGDELRVKLVTPNTLKHAHFLWEIKSSGALTIELYEGASGGMAAGTGVTPLNSDRNSSNTSGMVLTSGVDVATSDGTLISQDEWSSKSEGATTREHEIILKQNTIYLRKFISASASNIVSFKALWYEHTAEN